MKPFGPLTLVLVFCLGSFFSAPAAAQEDAAAPGVNRLEIRSLPEGARIYLNDRLVGETPALLPDLQPGRYRLKVEKDGYYPHAAWIDFAGGHQIFEVPLNPITGFLEVRTLPSGAVARVAGQEIPSGEPVELPVGRYTLRVGLFGYREEVVDVTISERSLSTVELSLVPAEFRLSSLQSSRRVFNPFNAGSLGRVRLSFEVTGPGRGLARILDPQGREVHRILFPAFHEWQQSFTWSGIDSRGEVLPDGPYAVLVQAQGRDDAQAQSLETTIVLDSSLAIRYRSLWNGSSGLLYTPVPEGLPAGSAQLSTLLAVGRKDGPAGPETEIPWNIGLRWGLSSGWEVDALAGIVAGAAGESSAALPFFLSASLKAPILERGSLGFLTSALLLKGTWQSSRSDLATNFTGFSMGLPVQASLGWFSLLLAPELILSPYRVSVGEPEPAHLRSWLYGRAGLLLDIDLFWIGFSTALRTTPFDEGFALDLPIETGLELHWLLPNTQLVLSLITLGEFRSAEDFTLSLGGGLGLLF